MSTKEILKTADKFEADARKLREAAEILAHSTSGEIKPYSGTRAEQLAAFIQEHGGAATRTEIVEESGIPPGTVASLLGTGKRFAKDHRGYWKPKPKPAQAEVMAPEMPLAKQA